MGKQAIVARFVDWNEAQMARGLLESNGIACAINDGNVAAIDWGVSLALGGIKLIVLDAADAPEAERLLDDVRQGEMSRALNALDASASADAERCPNCHSTNVFRPRSALSAVAAVLSATPFLLSSPQRHCRACGHEWTAAN
ncbi:MAG: DUF2007 domain-containing protein [Rhodospirillales bacterium]